MRRATASSSPNPRAAPVFHGAGAGEIGRVLREEHEQMLGAVERLRGERDEERCHALLRQVRRAWVIHALAEETVVYKALEGAPVREAAGAHADERFVEHELVQGLFEQLSRTRCSTLEWHARLNVARGIIARHIESEHEELFGQLASRFDAAGLGEIARRFRLAREKLTLLEEAKAA
jgi:hemerythrin-like domain-containing protein